MLAAGSLRRRAIPAAVASALRRLIYLTPQRATSDQAGASGRSPPIRVAATESAGRGVFAARGIAAGEVIHTAKPLVAHPTRSMLGKVCYYCLRRNPEKGDSPAIYFCSDNCKLQSEGFQQVEKRANWWIFDEHCRSRGLKYPFMVKRLACMVIAGSTSSDILDILQPSSLPQETLLQMEQEFKFLECSFKNTGISDESIAFLTKQWYFNAIARMRINAFRIELSCASYEDMFASAATLVAEDVSVGNAVYMIPSFYNHDCDPNAHIIWRDSADCKMMALHDIDQGEELRICYIDISMDREARQKTLAEGFGFHCQCSRCLSGD